MVNDMIEQVTDNETFLDIVDKLDYVKDCKLSKSQLYSYMVSGEYNKHIYAFASYDVDMNGCTVITINNDITGELTLYVIFLWISPHYRKLWKKHMEFIEEKGKEFKVKKINFTTNRSEKAIKKRLGKYGYKKIYNVIEKELI